MSSVAEKLARKSQNRGATSRQVRLNVTHLHLWSVVKVSLLVGVFLAVLGVFVTFVVWNVLNNVGAFNQLDSTITSVSDAKGGASARALFSLSKVMSVAIGLGVVNIIGTAIFGVVASALYNLSVRLTGGIHLGFSND